MNIVCPDISLVVDNYLCNSCGACLAICRYKAICFKETVGGYLFPVIDADVCVQCGLCYQVCPGVNFGKTLSDLLPSDPFVGTILSCRVGRACDDSFYLNGQSGGVVTALLACLLESGKVDVAIVVSEREGCPPRSEATLVFDPKNLKPSQKSKYTPVPILKSLSTLPKNTKSVAVVGLPCHIHGLKNLLDKCPEYRKINFYTLGLVCDRVMTNAAIDSLGRQATEESIKSLIWRDKQKDFYPGNPVVVASGGTEVVLKSSQRMELKDFFTPLRCRLCFDKLNIYSDIVCADPHGVKGIDRYGGETLVFVRSELGSRLIQDVDKEYVDLRAVSIVEGVTGQGMRLKQKEWSAYMKAWQEMSVVVPNYPFQSNAVADCRQQKKWLRHAISLEKYSTRDDVVDAYEKWLMRKKVKMTVLCPVDVIKRGLSRLMKGLGR